MRDRPDPQPVAPHDWGEAFAALPLESVPVGGWDAVVARLPARSPRWPIWLAVAAALALVVGLPLHRAARPDPATNTGTGVATHVPTAHATHAPPASSATALPSNIATGVAHAAQDPTVQPPSTGPQGGRGTASAARQDAVATEVASDTATPTDGTASAGGQVAQLQAESARLEALLALMQDGRVSSAGAALLGNSFDAQVRVIDAALMQPSLTPRQRTGLWRERVAALRQAVGFEGTQRLLAVSGRRDDARLASVD